CACAAPPPIKTRQAATSAIMPIAARNLISIDSFVGVRKRFAPLGWLANQRRDRVGGQVVARRGQRAGLASFHGRLIEVRKDVDLLHRFPGDGARGMRDELRKSACRGGEDSDRVVARE